MLNMGGAPAAPAPPPGAGGGSSSELYKVLVLDKFSRDVVAPLLRVAELRRHGVTLHLALEAERQPIPDVPAVYLLQPSQKGVERVAADLAAGLYDSLHLNFATAVPNKLLETLAAGALTSGNLGRVARVYDQYVSFIALEPSLFSLGLPGSYVELNDPAARDTQIEVRMSLAFACVGTYMCGRQGVLSRLDEFHNDPAACDTQMEVSCYVAPAAIRSGPCGVHASDGVGGGSCQTCSQCTGPSRRLPLSQFT